MFAVLLEGVDCHDRQVGVFLSIRSQIEVDHLLHNWVVGEAGSAHFREDRRSIDTQCHIADDLLDDLPPLLFVRFVDDVVQLAA